MKLTLYIKEQPIKAIINSASINLQLNNDVNDPSAKGTVSSNSIELTVDGAKIVNQYIADGNTGGMGIFEGLPARLEGEEGGEVLDLIDGYLDLADGNTEFECDKVTVNIVQRGGNDWFQKRKDAFSYAFLASLPDGAAGKISSSDYVYVPYIISTIPNTRDLAIISISIFVLGTQIRTVVKDLLQISVDFAGLASAARAAIKIILYIAYLVILIIAMIKLIKDLIKLIIQPIKFHAAMRMQTLLEKGAAYMGMEFISTNFEDELFKDLVIIPSKYQSFDDGSGSGVLGFKKPDPAKQTGYFEGTFGQVLEIYKSLTNGREIVGDGLIRVERVDKSTGAASYKIPAVEILSNRFNSDEIVSNTSIRFSTDISDTNTIDQLKGTFTDVIVEPLGVDNPDMVLLSGEKLVRTGVAQTKRKDDLTGPEQFLSEAVKILEPLLNAALKIAGPAASRKVPVGGISNLFENRKGMGSFSNDFHEVPKVVTLDIRPNPLDTKIKGINATRLTSDALYNESYFVNSFVPSAKLPVPNQWRKYKRGDIPFCFTDYKKLLNNNNRIFDTNDVEGKLISLDWQLENEVAEIEYWLQQMYTKNLKETILTPDGL